MSRLVKRGDTFTHDSHLDTSWKPGPGEKYADAPKLRCVVTRVNPFHNVVYFAPEGETKGAWKLPLGTFVARYGAQLGLDVLTEEPERMYSLVRDREGDIWRKGRTRWSCEAPVDGERVQRAGRLPWQHLVEMYGPLQLVRDGKGA